MEAKSDIKKYVFLNAFFDRFNLAKAEQAEVHVFDPSKYINEYVKIAINNNLFKQLGFETTERDYSTVKKMIKETRMCVPNKLRCPELRAFVTESMVQKLAALIIAEYDDIEKDVIKEKYPSTQVYKPVIAYNFTDFDKERNKLLTKFGNVVNIIVKKTFAELKHRQPKTADDAMKEIDTIINEYKKTKNDGDKKKQFDVNEDVFAKLQETYEAIIKYKPNANEKKQDSILSFVGAVAKEVKAMNINPSNVAIEYYISQHLPIVMEQMLATYMMADAKEVEVPHISQMIKVTIEAHDRPPKKEKIIEEEAIAAANEEPELEQKEEEPVIAADEPEPEPEKPKKVIKKKAHKNQK